jgi:hypothetical protein
MGSVYQLNALTKAVPPTIKHLCLEVQYSWTPFSILHSPYSGLYQCRHSFPETQETPDRRASRTPSSRHAQVPGLQAVHGEDEFQFQLNSWYHNQVERVSVATRD